MLGLIWLCVVGFLITVTTQAQETTPTGTALYHLRTLTPEEFITHLPNFSELSAANSSGQAHELLRAAEAEFLLKYAEIARFDELHLAFRKFNDEIYPANQTESVPVIDMNEWVARLTEQYLLENPTDLNTLTSVSFYPFAMQVEPHDFDGDGSNEWILDMQVNGSQHDSIIYRNYLVAVHEGDAYRVIPVPIPFLKDNMEWTAEGHGWNVNLGFRDVTGDGQPEWLFRRNVDAFGPNTTVFNLIYVVMWHDGSLTRVFAENADFNNLDDDAAVEFTDSYVREDNWGCGTVTTVVYDWNGNAYSQLPDQTRPLNCDGRHAEEAMWSGDFTTAASLYDAYLEANAERWANYVNCASQGDIVCDDSLWIQLMSYFQARRILAYAFLGDENHARHLLAQLPPANTPLRTAFMDALLAVNSADAEPLCRAAYRYFQENFTRTHDTFDGSFPFVPGIVEEDIHDGWQRPIYEIDPARAGCDVALFSGAPTPTPSPTTRPTYPPPTPDSRPASAWFIDRGNVYLPFIQGDYDMAQIVIDQAARIDDFDVQKFAYWQALLFDVTGQTPAALEAYTALYLSYPGSWWGWLAGLHLAA